MRRVKVKQFIEDCEELRIFCIDNITHIRTWDNRIEIHTTHNMCIVNREDLKHVEVIVDTHNLIYPTKTTNIKDFDEFVEYIREAI